MKKIFSKYLSLGSYSAVVPPLDDQSDTSTESHKTAPQETAAPAGPPPTAAGSPGKSRDELPSKDVPLQPPSSPQPPQQDKVPGSVVTCRDPGAKAKDPCATHAGPPPSPDASLRHLNNSSDRVAISPHVLQEVARSKRIFGVPVWWSSTRSLETQQRITSEMESAPSTVPLGQYSETKADCLAGRLCPVYKRDSRMRGERWRWWQRYAVLVALVVVCLTVLLGFVLLAVMMRRPGAHHHGNVSWGPHYDATKGVLNTSEA